VRAVSLVSDPRLIARDTLRLVSNSFHSQLLLSPMTHTQLTLPDSLDQRITTLAKEQGKKKEEIILEAVEAYVQKPINSEDMLAKRRKAFGMWKDRTDLPDFVALRRE